jgi:heme A synthase
MRRLLAIAGLAVRASIRSRLVIALLLILLGVVIGLPRTVQSDGTPEGYVRVVMGYTMGLASLLLSLTALWSGALSIAREVDEKQIPDCVCSKPVHRLEIWAGQMAGPECGARRAARCCAPAPPC